MEYTNRKLTTTSGRTFVVFDDVHFGCIQKQLADCEQVWAHLNKLERSLLVVGSWYSEHLQGRIPMVVLHGGSGPSSLPAVGDGKNGVEVVTVEQYAAKYRPFNEMNRRLFESLLETSAINQSEKYLRRMNPTLPPKAATSLQFTVLDRNEFPEYLSEEELLAGLKGGYFVSGYLRVDKYRSNERALVTCQQVDGMNGQVQIGIVGSLNRNRAIDGDEVVVEIIEWVCMI